MKHRKFKSDVLKTIKKWSLMFKQHLMDHVTNSLNDLEEFIREHDKGLSAPVKEGDIDALVVMMGHLMAVKDRQPTTDNMFEPLKQTLELLKSFQQEMPDEVYDQLQELPEKWNNLKKKATIVKQNVAPLQANEVNNIRKRAATFDVIQYQFRERFRQIPPLRYITKIYPIQLYATGVFYRISISYCSTSKYAGTTARARTRSSTTCTFRCVSSRRTWRS